MECLLDFQQDVFPEVPVAHTLIFCFKEVYGRSLNLFSWSERRLLQTIPLGVTGTASLEIRFLHDPRASQGYVGCAVYAKVYR